MIPHIEEQIHQFHKELEEKRCEALEAKYNKNKATYGKKVKRNSIPKPWTRPCENALCQDIDLLIMVDQYDFDLTNDCFQEYCLARGVLHVAGEVGSRRWEYFLDHTKTKKEYLADPFHQYAQEINGKSYRYTANEIELGWKIILLGRAQLQDCWELFSSNAPN